MANRFWTWVQNIADGSTARAEQVNAQYSGIDGGLKNVENEMNRTIRFTDGGVPAEDAFQVAQTAAQRSNLLLGFDSLGNVALKSGVFTWRGNWTGPNTGYNINDIVRAPSSHNLSLYVATAQHISAASFAADLGAGRWALAVDLSQVERAIKKFQIVTTSQTLVAGDDVFVDVSAGAITLTLPTTPSISDQPIHVCHVGGNIAANPITIARNGQRIMGLTEDMTVNLNNAAFELAFCDATRGWRLIKGT